MSLSSNPHPSTSTDGTLKDDESTTTLHQLAKSFILLEASIKKIDDLECQLEDANGRLDVIDFYDQNPPSDDDEGEYDEERWDRIKEDLEVQLEKLKLERADRMLDLVHWAAKVKTGKFLPAEVLAMVHDYSSLEDDEDDEDDDDDIWNDDTD